MIEQQKEETTAQAVSDREKVLDIIRMLLIVADAPSPNTFSRVGLLTEIVKLTPVFARDETYLNSLGIHADEFLPKPEELTDQEWGDRFGKVQYLEEQDLPEPAAVLRKSLPIRDEGDLAAAFSARDDYDQMVAVNAQNIEERAAAAAAIAPDVTYFIDQIVDFEVYGRDISAPNLGNSVEDYEEKYGVEGAPTYLDGPMTAWTGIYYENFLATFMAASLVMQNTDGMIDDEMKREAAESLLAWVPLLKNPSTIGDILDLDKLLKKGEKKPFAAWEKELLGVIALNNTAAPLLDKMGVTGDFQVSNFTAQGGHTQQDLFAFAKATNATIAERQEVTKEQRLAEVQKLLPIFNNIQGVQEPLKSQDFDLKDLWLIMLPIATVLKLKQIWKKCVVGPRPNGRIHEGATASSHGSGGISGVEMSSSGQEASDREIEPISLLRAAEMGVAVNSSTSSANGASVGQSAAHSPRTSPRSTRNVPAI